MKKEKKKQDLTTLETPLDCYFLKFVGGHLCFYLNIPLPKWFVLAGMPSSNEETQFSPGFPPSEGTPVLNRHLVMSRAKLSKIP